MIIVGLPRSRTAWLSVFMSQSGVYFHHEAINGCHSIGEYEKKISGCGDSTTCLDVLDLHEKKVIIVKSDDELEQCVYWCDQTYLANSREYITHLNERLKSTNGLIVNQSEINERLSEIWRYLLGSELSPQQRRMVNFNIQVQSTEIDKGAAKAFYESIQQNTQQLRH